MAESQFPFEGEIVVHGSNKVSIVKLGNKHPIGVIIEDETIHGMVRLMFELAWKGAQ